MFKNQEKKEKRKSIGKSTSSFLNLFRKQGSTKK